MVTLEWSCERSDGVTLVSLVVAADRPCRVCVENRLDGPVWPPRRRGQPATGWDGDAFAGRVPADGRLTVGYATPARPDEPPAEVVSTTPVERSDGAADSSAPGPAPAVESTPAGVVRDLGDPVVPRDSVPLPEPDAARLSAPSDDGESGREPGAGAGGQSVDAAADTERFVVPGAVRAWLRDVEERLGADSGRPGKRTAGSDPEAALGAAVAADRRALGRVRDRVDELLARADDEGGGREARPAGERAGSDGRVGGGGRTDETRPGGAER